MNARNTEAALLGELFRGLGQWIPGRDLAQRAGLPPRDLPRVLAPYLEAGYPIQFHPQGGVRLDEPPDIWCAEEILGRCPAQKDQPMWEPLLLAETSSTSDVVRERAVKGAPAGFVVAASRQTRGRGRRGRSWESARDAGLYVSILLRPELAVRDAGQLTILGSVAMADAVEAVSGLRPQIKWPNDLMADRRKLGGLLIETEPVKARLAFAVIGIGINVNQESGDFSPDVQSLATSLRLLTGKRHRRADLLVALLHAITARLAKPFAEAQEAWAASSLTLGQQVMLTTLRGVKHGQAVGLDASGALLLRGDSGEIEPITAGDMQAC
jgi:BirA family biotin operon repressor/biotin-[acetyl-CoA-carboxylase] ligase